MSYTQMEVAYFLALVAASGAPGAQGTADAIHVANSFSPSIPDHLARSAIENFASQQLVIIISKYLAGGVIIQITGKGLQAAERLSAPSQPEPNPVGFRGK